ncbi:hypothetical protein [uncultured Pelagimonas sp.]|uniref:hypothetical protein n=1 Tax=uncultured Pelagimonas sp. TaxID=1618102 RepID=UPI0026208CF9|nr:hypothetical protein [uncultured Pelagimonas sp.]
MPNPTTPATAEVAPLRPRVDIPVCDPAPDAKAQKKAFERGQFLVRQDACDTLAKEIRTAEENRQLTPGLASVTHIMAKGARSDILTAMHAMVSKAEPKKAQVILASLEASFEDCPDDPTLAYILAMAHVDLAQLWRGASRVRDLAPQRRDAFDTHIQAAAALADRYDPFELDSPLWAEVRCAVLEADPRPAQRVSDDFEDLIDLDPTNPSHLLALGRELLPRNHGTLELLDIQARRQVALLKDIWGTGAYTWVFMGALQIDPSAFRRVEPELFVEGMHDILGRHPSQHMANVMAAFSGLTIAAPSEDNSSRMRLMDCFSWILQDHLRELHPLIWALAPVPGKPNMCLGDDVDLVKFGTTRAIGSIAQHFAPALDAGRRLVFTPDGLQLR